MRLVHDRLDDHGRRIRELELNEAGANQWRKNTTEKLDLIILFFKCLFGAFVTGLIGAVITFIVAGGLNVAP